MPYKVTFSESVFADCMMNLPKTVQKKIIRAIDQLQINPEKPDGKIKKLEGFKHLWRYRVGNYRFVYEVKGETVKFILAGSRKNVYELLNYDPEQKKPGIQISGKRPDILDKTPEAADVVASLEQQIEEEDSTPEARSLPDELSREKLHQFGVPQEMHEQVLGCSTDEELLNTDIPDNILGKIIEGLWPKNLGERLNDPSRVVQDCQALDDVLEGKRDWRSLILDLDKEQNEFVRGYGRGEKGGPWILKGGPGSGKSTVALYCIRDLIAARKKELGLQGMPRILYTTYTNSLRGCSQYLLSELLEGDKTCSIRTINWLAMKIFGQHWDGDIDFVKESDNQKYLRESIKAVQDKVSQPRFGIPDLDFVKDEIEWLIIGNNITNLDFYSKFDRTGRSRRLGERQREQLWQIYQHYKTLLKTNQVWTQDQIVCNAYWLKTKGNPGLLPSYDFVFIDEAQDLKPIAIRFAIAMCKDPKNVFLTADTNQTLFGKGFSWVGIDSALRGAKHRRLEKNYRSTKEIVDAVNEIAQRLVEPDKETLGTDSPYLGPPPVIRYVNSSADKIQAIEGFIRRGMSDLSLGPAGSAVLTRTNDAAQRLANSLPEQLRPAYLHTKENALDHPGIKVMTIHAGKGLEFPITIVADVDARTLPFDWQGPERSDNMNADRKLFFVGCSRAMRRLMVTTDQDCPSMFVTDLSEDNWEHKMPAKSGTNGRQSQNLII